MGTTDSGGAARPRLAVLLGGAHGALAAARCLKKAGLQVWLVTQEDSCASYSAAVFRVVHWPGPQHPEALPALESIAREFLLQGSLLVPAGDAEVHLVAHSHRRLSSLFVMLTPAWEQLRWACDKSLLHRRAQQLGLGVPRTWDARSPAGLNYPLVLKPAMRLHDNRFTNDRAWRVDDAEGFRLAHAAASRMVGAEQVVVQEWVPGGGGAQLSYGGVWNAGRPVAGLTARRLRQYPAQFSHTSTYVESADLPDVRAAAELFLASIRHHGFAEVEFKRDERDGMLKLLDVNPRPWNWMGLAAPAGIDLGRAIRSLATAGAVPPVAARAGAAWIFVSRDLRAAASTGRLRPRSLLAYAATWLRVRSFACFSWADPLPALVDGPLTLARLFRRRSAALRATASPAVERP